VQIFRLSLHKGKQASRQTKLKWFDLFVKDRFGIRKQRSKGLTLWRKHAISNHSTFRSSMEIFNIKHLKKTPKRWVIFAKVEKWVELEGLEWKRASKGLDDLVVFALLEYFEQNYIAKKQRRNGQGSSIVELHTIQWTSCHLSDVTRQNLSAFAEEPHKRRNSRSYIWVMTN